MPPGGIRQSSGIYYSRAIFSGEKKEEVPSKRTLPTWNSRRDRLSVAEPRPMSSPMRSCRQRQLRSHLTLRTTAFGACPSTTSTTSSIRTRHGAWIYAAGNVHPRRNIARPPTGTSSASGCQKNFSHSLATWSTLGNGALINCTEPWSTEVS